MSYFKQTILTLVITLITFTSSAQNGFSAKTKGTFLASGTFSLNSTSSKQTFEDSTLKGNTFNLTAGPKAGYFIMDNLAMGLELELGISSDDDTDNTTTRIGLGPFAKYYFDNGLFGEATAVLGSSKTTSDFAGFEIETKSNALGFKIGGGYALFLGDHIAIEPAVFYVLQSSKPKGSFVDTKTTLSTIALTIGFTAFF